MGAGMLAMQPIRSRRYIRLRILLLVLLFGTFLYLSQLNSWTFSLLSPSGYASKADNALELKNGDEQNAKFSPKKQRNAWVIDVIKVPLDDMVEKYNDVEDFYDEIGEKALEISGFNNKHHEEKKPAIVVPVETRKVVNAHDFAYIHNIPDACKKDAPELVIGVQGKTDNLEARNTIRETWGHREKGSHLKVLLIFLLGTTKNKTVQDFIDREAKSKGDIVQESFADSYRNLTFKTMALMRWVSTFCKQSKFVLKSDDDIYINVPILLTKLREWSSDHKNDFIIGYVHTNISVMRNERSRYWVSKKEYEPDVFPDYVSGTSYALTTGAAEKLYTAAQYIPKICLEDVFMTGIVAENVKVPRLRERAFTKYTFNGCDLRDKICSGHRNSPADIRRMHEELFEIKKKCNDTKDIKSH